MMRHRIASVAAEHLRRLINERYVAGDQLPPEVVLAEELKISRNTLREAMSELVLTGDIERKWGVGTFVRHKEKAVTLSLAYIQPIDEVLRAQGREFSLEYASARKEPVHDAPAVALGVPLGAEVWLCERVFSMDGTPFAYLRDSIPTTVNGRTVDLSDFAEYDGGLIAKLEDESGLLIDRMEGMVGATTRDVDAEQHLHSGGQPFLQLEQHMQSSGTTVWHGLVYYRPEFVRLSYFRVSPTTAGENEFGPQSTEEPLPLP